MCLQVVALAIPFAASLAKQSLVAAEETQYCRLVKFVPSVQQYEAFYIDRRRLPCSVACTEQPAQNKGKRWKPHDKLRSVWPAIFALVGLASWLVYRKGGLIQQRDPLGRYVCLLAANLLCWPPVFFGGHSRRFACLDSAGTLLDARCSLLAARSHSCHAVILTPLQHAVLLLSSLLTIPKFYEVSPAAGLLLLPYLGWTCFASTLINCSFLSGNAKASVVYLPGRAYQQDLDCPGHRLHATHSIGVSVLSRLLRKLNGCQHSRMGATQRHRPRTLVGLRQPGLTLPRGRQRCRRPAAQRGTGLS